MNLGSNCNYIFSSGCGPLAGLTATIRVTQDIVCEYTSGPTKGFSFQLNACPPKGRKSARQQYLIAQFGNDPPGAVRKWPNRAAYSVMDGNGQTLANVLTTLEEVAPVVAFELNLVGPVNSDSAVLPSYAGYISYQGATPLTAMRTGAGVRRVRIHQSGNGEQH